MFKQIHRKYSAELKQKVVQEQEYLSGKGSLRDLAKKYELADETSSDKIMRSNSKLSKIVGVLLHFLINRNIWCFLHCEAALPKFSA